MKVAQSCLTLRTYGLYSPWNSLGQNTGVGTPSFLQGIFPTRDGTQVFRIAGRFLTSWATRKGAGIFLIPSLSSLPVSPRWGEVMWPLWRTQSRDTGPLKDWFLLKDCEMKISPDILINNKYHSHQRILATKYEWGLQKVIQGMLPPSTVVAEELWTC